MSVTQSIISWIYQNFLPSFLSVFIVTLIIGFLSIIYQNKIISWVYNKYYLFRNKTMIASVKSVYTYPVPDSGPVEFTFTSEVCQRIVSQMDNSVSNPDWGDNWASFDVEDVPSRIKIRFEPRMDRSMHNPSSGTSTDDISGYKFVVESENDLYFGYNEMFPLIKFRTFSEKAREVIEAECLPREVPNTTRIQVSLKEGIPKGLTEINDEELNITGMVQQDALDMTFRSPENLQKGLRKYFESTN
jgi:hypothetical protein